MKKKHNWKEIQEHYDDNGSYRSIEKNFNINSSSISKAVKRGDLKTRSRSEATKLGHKNSSYKMSDETKKKISIARTKYLKENPDQVPYLVNHSSKESYPEKYFTKVFKNEKIDVEKSYRFGLYELDFAIPSKKIDIEVDGSQHRVDSKIVESDKKRTKLLEEDGWDVIRINWSEYQKQSSEEKEKYIRDLISYINNLSNKKPTINIIRLPKGKDLCECGEVKSKKAKRCMKCHFNFRKENKLLLRICKCGNKKHKYSKLCWDCYIINKKENDITQRKVKERPSLEQLLQDIKDTNYAKTGEKYGVSDTTIRKWIKQYKNN